MRIPKQNHLGPFLDRLGFVRMYISLVWIDKVRNNGANLNTMFLDVKETILTQIRYRYHTPLGEILVPVVCAKASKSVPQSTSCQINIATVNTYHWTLSI